VLNLSSASFDQALSDHAVVFVCFYAPVRYHLPVDHILSYLKNPCAQWCKHCKSLLPEFEKAASTLAAQHAGKGTVALAKIDATVVSLPTTGPPHSVLLLTTLPPPFRQEQGPTARAGIVGYPTLVLFHHSLEVEHYTGGRTSRLLVQYVEGYCSKHL